MNRDVEQLVGSIDEDAAKPVLRKQLGRPLGPPFSAGDEQYCVAALAHALDLGDPFLNAATKLGSRLTGDVQDGSRRARGSRGVNLYVGPVLLYRRGISDCQLIDARRIA